MRIGDCLSVDVMVSLANAHVDIGNVYASRMDETNGITPKNGAKDRRKFFVVLGVDDEGIIYGGVVINHAINPKISPKKQHLHYPIAKSKYSFLEEDSFVNCVDLKILPLEKLLLSEFLGNIQENDLENITMLVIQSPFCDSATLERFHIK